MSANVVYYWIDRDVIPARRLNGGSPYWITVDDKKEEVGRLKGEINAIEQTAIQKDCMAVAQTIRAERAAALERARKKEAEKERKDEEEEKSWN